MLFSTPGSAELKEIKSWTSLLLLIWAGVELVHLGFFGTLRIVEIFSLGDGRYVFLQIAAQFSMATLFMWIAGWVNFPLRQAFLLAAVGVLTAFYAYYYGEITALPALILYALIPFSLALIINLVREWVATGKSWCLPLWAKAYFLIAVFALALAAATTGMLKITSIIFPLTYDFHFYKIDAAFGGVAQRVAMAANNADPLVKQITMAGYGLLGFLFLPLMAYLIREGKHRVLHGWRTFLVPFAVAWMCYMWVPMSGPIYAFPGSDFPANLPSPDSLQSGLSVIPPALRNGMPSMHLTGALLILMITAALRRKLFFYLACGFVIITIWATMALGEHYLIDLVVAVPFAVLLGAVLIAPPGWIGETRRYLLWSTASIFALWMILFKVHPQWLEESPNVVRMLSIGSLLLGGGLFFSYLKVVWTLEDLAGASRLSESSIFEKRHLLLPVELQDKKWLIGIFFFSGFAGLMYEVVYAKALGVTFGGTALASYTVLATYMGGMALGAWIGGIWAERVEHPVRLYAIIEAVIGVYAVLTPVLFKGIQWIYVQVTLDHPPDAGWLTVLRVILGAVTLGIPTVLMGATLPLIFKELKKLGMRTESAIAPLYTANIVGAAIGALVTAYIVLPAVGKNSATYLAAVISLLVSLYVFEKLKSENFTVLPAREASALVSSPVTEINEFPAVGKAALTVLFIGGVVTLALEVVYMHMLAIVAGNSVYAFGLMLATFLLGLGIGSAVAERVMHKGRRSVFVAGAQGGLAIAIWATALLWDHLAEYMGSFGYSQMAYGVHLDFASREIIRAIVCAMAMLPPAFFIGMSYPATMGIAADWLSKMSGQSAKGLGLASGMNTFGNIIGVLLAGFLLLPLLGSRNTMWSLALIALSLGILMLLVTRFAIAKGNESSAKVGGVLIVAAIVNIAFFPKEWNLTALSGGGNVYFQKQYWGEVIDHAESVEGGFTAVAKRTDGLLTLLTNGKFQGNNAEAGEMVAQESFALIPLMHTTKRDSALVIGYGTGMTARVLQDQGFVEQDVVELSRDIVRMADKHFANINSNISAHPSVRMHYTDGRNYLLTQSKQYDLISLEISSIWFAGAANLYNREFYELAKKRLLPQGVLQQWVQLHHMRPIDFIYIVGSVRSVFKNVWIYVSGGQGIIVASDAASAVDNYAAIEKLLAGHTISGIDVKDLPSTLVASPDQVDAFIHRYDQSTGIFVSTDNNLHLEYATPKGNAVIEETLPILVNMLKGIY